jgi:hypothetical protein
VIATSELGGFQSGIALLPAGKLVMAGYTPFRDVPVERQAIIGGTGRYAGARGHIRVRGLPDGNSVAVTVRLLG